jgi:hypothetical protein
VPSSETRVSPRADFVKAPDSRVHGAYEAPRGAEGPVNAMMVLALFAPEIRSLALGRRHSRSGFMATKGFRERLALAVGLLGVVTIALAAAPAGAAPRGGHAGAPSGAHQHGDYTRHTERTKTDNGHAREDTWTNGQGKTATRDANVVNDRDNGTRTRDVDWQGPNGKTATREDVTQRTSDGYTRDSTFTGPNGKTATRDATVVRDKDAGTVSRDVVETGPNGKTRTIDDDVQRTADGYTRDTVRTNPNGSTVTRDVTATYDKDTKTFSKDVSVDHERPTPPAAQP